MVYALTIYALSLPLFAGLTFGGWYDDCPARNGLPYIEQAAEVVNSVIPAGPDPSQSEPQLLSPPDMTLFQRLPRPIPFSAIFPDRDTSAVRRATVTVKPRIVLTKHKLYNEEVISTFGTTTLCDMIDGSQFRDSTEIVVTPFDRTTTFHFLIDTVRVITKIEDAMDAIAHQLCHECRIADQDDQCIHFELYHAALHEYLYWYFNETVPLDSSIASLLLRSLDLKKSGCIEKLTEESAYAYLYNELSEKSQLYNPFDLTSGPYSYTLRLLPPRTHGTETFSLLARNSAGESNSETIRIHDVRFTDLARFGCSWHATRNGGRSFLFAGDTRVLALSRKIDLRIGYSWGHVEPLVMPVQYEGDTDMSQYQLTLSWLGWRRGAYLEPFLYFGIDVYDTHAGSTGSDGAPMDDHSSTSLWSNGIGLNFVISKLVIGTRYELSSLFSGQHHGFSFDIRYNLQIDPD